MTVVRLSVFPTGCRVHRAVLSFGIPAVHSLWLPPAVGGALEICTIVVSGTRNR